MHEDKKQLAFRLHRSKMLVDKKDQVIANIEKIQQQQQGQNYFSKHSSESLASADLQGLIKTAIASAGGQLTSTQVLPSTLQGRYKRIMVKVRMSGSIEVLRNVLNEIENALPIIVIDQLDIRPTRGKRNRKTRKIEPTNKLNVNFQAVTFMREAANE